MICEAERDAVVVGDVWHIQVHGLDVFIPTVFLEDADEKVLENQRLLKESKCAEHLAKYLTDCLQSYKLPDDGDFKENGHA